MNINFSTPFLLRAATRYSNIFSSSPSHEREDRTNFVCGLCCYNLSVSWGYRVGQKQTMQMSQGRCQVGCLCLFLWVCWCRNSSYVHLLGPAVFSVPMSGMPSLCCLLSPKFPAICFHSPWVLNSLCLSHTENRVCWPFLLVVNNQTKIFIMCRKALGRHFGPHRCLSSLVETSGWYEGFCTKGCLHEGTSPAYHPANHSSFSNCLSLPLLDITDNF